LSIGLMLSLNRAEDLTVPSLPVESTNTATALALATVLPEIPAM
jgi:hypothetical protein